MERFINNEIKTKLYTLILDYKPLAKFYIFPSYKKGTTPVHGQSIADGWYPKPDEKGGNILWQKQSM
ncbi:MAG TPA: hypothetical protein PLE91_02840 [Methanothermobacter sp.]|nr:hypothetical protein [Methanothermobacter sp.]